MESMFNKDRKERLQVIDKLKTFCHINTALLPFKLIFFFSFGGFAGILPFMPLIAKQIGINATGVGIGYSVVPVFILISNPLVGFLVDYFQNIKVFLIVFLISSAAAYSSVLGLPPIAHETELIHVQVYGINSSEQLIDISTPFDRDCLGEILEKEIQCQLELDSVNVTVVNETNIASYSPSSINITYNGNGIFTANNDSFLNFYAPFNGIKYKRTTPKSFWCSPSIHQCSIPEDSDSVFSTYQFWTFCTLVIIGGVTWISCMTLCCVACCEIVGTRIELYGRQRLFGTISSGAIASLAGILNDKFASSEQSYVPGFYVMVLFLVTDIIILSAIDIPKAHASTNMSADIGKIFRSKEIVVFSLGVSLIGFLATFISMFEFWFLKDMGASQTLLGLSVAVQCLLAEVPFLFFSGWFVKTFGHFSCLAIAFAGFVARFMFYSILKDPWLVLPVDLLHGVTYGVYHGAMASFAKEKAPKGMEATLLGIYGGLYDGLGHGIGSFLGGIGFDQLGTKRTFFISSMLSLGCLLLFLVASYAFKSPNNRELPQMSEFEMEDVIRNEEINEKEEKNISKEVAIVT